MVKRRAPYYLCHYTSFDKASDSLSHYLGEESFEEASVWMDQMRRQSGYAYLNSWHYVNFEKDQTFVQSRKPNIITRVQLAIHNLRVKNDDYETTQFNLKILGDERRG